MSLEIKICGLSTHETLDAALGGGADMVGLVFFPRSPRHVEPAAAHDLAARARGRARIVALTVDAEDDALATIIEQVRPDMLQLHGSETPERVDAIRSRFGVPVMKAIGIATADDLAHIEAYAAVADRLLLDAKAPPGALLPGGNGAPFDWSLIATRPADRRFMLSGGLDPRNVSGAVRLVRPAGIDVSSGVERAPGVKDPELITAFIRAVRSADTNSASPSANQTSLAS